MTLFDVKFSYSFIDKRDINVSTEIIINNITLIRLKLKV